MRKIIFLLAIVLVFPALAMAKNVITVANVYIPNAATLAYLGTFDIQFEESEGNDYARIVGDREVIEDIQRAGFEVEILIDDLTAWVEARRKAIESRPQEAAPVDEVNLDHYLTHTEMGTYLNDLAAAYPDIMSLETIGQSVSGRALYLVKISDNVDTNEAEPAFFMEASIHGDEIACYIHSLYTIEWLLTNYETDDAITDIVNNTEIFIEPLTNPDGNYDDPTWGRSRYNDNGVDMNRNNGYMWYPSSTYGTTLHSEPETIALAHVWARPQPYILGISEHSGTIVVSLPWSYHMDEPLDWDEADYLGEQYCYPNYCLDPNMDTWYQGSIGMYQMNGSTKDELYGSHGAMAWSQELTYTKECSWATTAAVLTNHEPAMQFVLEEIQQGLHGTVTDSADGGPVAAVIQVEGKWATFADYEVGDYHKYLRPGTYNVHVFANGYQEYNETITILADTPYTLNVELDPDPNPKTFIFRWLYSRFPNDADTHTLTIDTLGPPDSEFASMGHGGYAIVDLGPDGLDNGAGDDIAVYEAYTDGDEGFTLYGSSDNYFGPWVQIGAGSGPTSFDLTSSGLPNVRYVKIVDQNDDEDPNEAGQYDGFDLDAIGSPQALALFNADVTSGEIPLTVNFNDQSTGNPTSWDWDFGDGDTSTEQNPTHVYDETGEYTVTLTIDGPAGSDTMVRTNYISAYEGAPAADFSGTPTTGTLPLEVTFTSTSTGTISTYYWEFGDGQTSDQENPVHTYNEPGNYPVRLTVTGPGGSDNKLRLNYIHANCPAPVADFTADVTTGDAPLTVTFTNTTDVPDACPATYQWDFGDGNISTEENPTNVYTDDGVYTVKLTAGNAGGSDAEEKDDFITVGDQPDDDTDDDDDATPDDDDDTGTDDDSDDDDSAPTVDDDDDDNDDSGCGC